MISKAVRNFFLGTVLVLLCGYAPSDLATFKQKLHPAFQSVIAKYVSETGLDSAAGALTPSAITEGGVPLYDVIIFTQTPEAVKAEGVHINSTVGKFSTARLEPNELWKLAQLEAVEYLDPGAVYHPTLDLSVPETGANLLQNGFLNNVPYKGKGVIVLVFDTGIDWRHLDFRDPVDTTKSRILAIWDQTISPIGSETPPSGLSYGVEYTKQQIEAELGSSPPRFVREKDINGHGTNVTGIAAGNGNSYFKKYVGMAPEADIIVVKGGDGSFSESGEIDALTYAGNKAVAFGEPVVVNMSLGGQSGPHDGTHASEVAVNSFVQTAGRVVAVSAGNDGGEIIHSSGTISSGGSTSVQVTVPTYTPTAGTNNDKFQLEVWFNGNINVNATVTSPRNITYTANSGQTGTSSNNTDGTISLYNTSSGSTNGNRYVWLIVSDQTSNVPKTGTWTLTLSGASSAASFNAWLSSYTVGSSAAAIVNGNSSMTVESPGTADGAITVASYVTKNSWSAIDGNNYIYPNNPAVGTISDFSSIGPSADGRQKPEIAAPGQGIASSLSGFTDVSSQAPFVMIGGKDFLMQGTSQAAPHVTGASALLFQILRGLTASQIKTLLTTTAVTDGNTGSVPNPTWGYGKMDILKAAVKVVSPQATVQKQTLVYDVDGTNQIFGAPFLTGSTKYALRFTPSITGQLTGMLLNITTTANRPIQGVGPLVCEVWSNTPGSVSGVPGTRLGNTVLQAFQRLTPGTNNFIDMTAANVTVSAGQDYHLVISVANAQDTIKVRADQSIYATPTGRTSYFNGSRWYNVTDASSTVAPQNIRIRAMVTSLGISAPSAPSLLSPADNAVGISLNPTLSWSTAAGANFYNLQISSNSSFTPLIANVSGIVGTSYPVPTLSLGTIYYWRVSATNVAGTSGYSVSRSFTTVNRKRGDVDGNGVVQAADASYVLKYVAGLSTTPVDFTNPAVLYAADASNDGQVTAYDASLILQAAASLITLNTIHGDVTTLGKGATIPQASGNLEMGSPEATTDPAVVNVAMKLTNSVNVYSMQLVCKTDMSKLSIEAVKLSLPEGWDMEWNVVGNELRIAVAGTTPLTNPNLGTIAVRFKDNESRLYFSTEALLNENAHSFGSFVIAAIPTVFGLEQNYPNPFNPTTTIRYQLPKSAIVSIEIYNTLGQLVATLVDGHKEAGYYQVQWSSNVPSGIYFYRLQAGAFVETKKMILLK